MLLMVCGLSNCFSFYMRINLSTFVCYMHGVFDKMPQKDYMHGVFDKMPQKDCIM